MVKDIRGYQAVLEGDEDLSYNCLSFIFGWMKYVIGKGSEYIEESCAVSKEEIPAVLKKKKGLIPILESVVHLKEENIPIDYGVGVIGSKACMNRQFSVIIYKNELYICRNGIENVKAKLLKSWSF